MFLAKFFAHATEPACQVGRESVSPQPPIPTIPCATQVCPHMHSKVEKQQTYSPL